jgi:CHAT domain-containing protein/tetratricopeptide (TPR) repeat protein
MVLTALFVSLSAVGGTQVQGADDLTALQRQVSQLYDHGKYVEAIPIAERYVSLARRKHGENHVKYALAIAWLASLYEAQGRYTEAEPLRRRTLASDEKSYGREHPEVATDLISLAALYRDQGRYGEAEPLYKRSLAIREKALGPDDPDIATSLAGLAALYWTQERYVEAEPLYKRALAIREKALGPDDADVASLLNSLAALYYGQARYSEAEPLYNRSLAIYEKELGPDAPDIAPSLNNLAALYQVQNRYPEAEPLYNRALAIREKALGPDHPDVATSLNNLATLYLAQGRYTDVESLSKRALTIVEKVLGADHPYVAMYVSNLADLYLAQVDWARAAHSWRRGTGIIARRAQQGIRSGEITTGKGKSESQRQNYQFFGLLKTVYRLATGDPKTDLEDAREMFETAQWALASEAAVSLAQMAARAASGDPAIVVRVRERQDLVAEWQKLDSVRTAAVSLSPAKRDQKAEAAMGARLEAINKRIGEIDATLKDKYPDFAALSNPAPLSVADVQTLLGSDEALVMFLDTPEMKPTAEETFVWVVTKSEVRWVRSDLGTRSLQYDVAGLRCGLDYDGTWGAEPSRCSDQLKTSYTDLDHRKGKPLPFDLLRAHALYKALFGKFEDMIEGKHLLIVPSGALTQLPFQVLNTAKPDGRDFRSAAWLVKSHALTILPSVSSLKALRQLAKASHATRTLIGFGNPLLDGPDARYSSWAAAARWKTSCSKIPEQRVAALTSERGGVLPLNLRGGNADVAQIRSQVPLPETADELCAVAQYLSVSGDDIWLGNRAREAEIKCLSEAGELAKYRIIHFATHGALAGQVSANSEPGLILTPPKAASERDDGYLSASEIAALKLDADWVILSACNTAAGGANAAEPLSGLARAFFYAGARALLVTHWSVYSNATVKLITGAIGRMAANKGVGRAEAMRQSMLAMIDKGEPLEAHPAYWAPFAVVGEGGTPSASPATTSTISGYSPGNAQVKPKKKLGPKDWRQEVLRK